jgi:hypothetical protein
LELSGGSFALGTSATGGTEVLITVPLAEIDLVDLRDR